MLTTTFLIQSWFKPELRTLLLYLDSGVAIHGVSELMEKASALLAIEFSTNGVQSGQLGQKTYS